MTRSRIPENDRAAIHFVTKRLTPEEEIKAVVKSLSKWLPENQDSTVAVLVPRNTRGVEVINALKAKNIEYVEFLSSTSNTRAAAGALSNLIAYLADPAVRAETGEGLSGLAAGLAEATIKERCRTLDPRSRSAWLRKVGNVEDYVNPNLAFARGETHS